MLSTSPKIITRKTAELLELKEYFTGIPCRFGHISTRATSTGACNECRRIRGKIKDVYIYRRFAKKKEKDGRKINI